MNENVKMKSIKNCIEIFEDASQPPKLPPLLAQKLEEAFAKVNKKNKEHEKII